jgi:hypothetical protein
MEVSSQLHALPFFTVLSSMENLKYHGDVLINKELSFLNENYNGED